MTPQDKIARLEGLLARVHQRGVRTNGAPTVTAAAPVQAAPRALAAPPVPAAPFGEDADARTVRPAAGMFTEELAPPATVIEANLVVPVSAQATQKPLAVSLPPLPDTSGWSDPPPPETSTEPETDIPPPDDSDVEVSAEVVEIDIDEPGFVPAESGAQPVAEQIADIMGEPSPEELPEELLAKATSRPPPLEVAPSEPPPPPANEIVEPEPSSSPRPIVVESYEEESAPRHTPPPESGKQVAAPSVKPEPPRKSSVPPPSLEGHTLVGVAAPASLGGWREPGIARPAATPPRAPEPVKLTPETTRADLPGAANVARVEGTAPSFSPATFGDLLDATLSL
jgi:hypothetical protein